MVFLSLALLLLAFFALLNAISTIEDGRSRRVVDSVVATFSDPFVFRASDEATEPVPEIVFAERYFSDIARLFRRAVELIRVEVIDPGRVMQVNIAARRLFVADTSRIAARGKVLLSRVAAALTEAPPGVRLDLEVLLEGAADATATVDDRAIARAGAIARMLTAEGVSPDNVSIGLLARRGGKVRMVFHVRPEAEGPLNRLPVADSAAAEEG
jgi:hypothetical protein